MATIIPDYKHKLTKRLKFFRDHYKDPLKLIAKILLLYPFNSLLPDRLYLSIMYRGFTGLRLHLDNPMRFNEKMQWLKLNDRKEWHSKIADKVEVREYVTARIGEQYLIPVIAVYNSVDEIEWSKLTNQFVLKTTHDSGTTVICSNKEGLNVEEAKKFLKKRMARSYYPVHREFCYKNIKPRIICEAFISTDGNSIPLDYKFYCFHGVPKLIQIDTDRFTDHGRVIMYPDWNKAPFSINSHYKKQDLKFERPSNLDEMLTISTKLSQDFKFIRVDLYSVNNKIYFGELTFHHGSGYDDIDPDEYDFWLGNLLDLNKQLKPAY